MQDLNMVVMDNHRVADTTHQLPLVVEDMVPLPLINSNDHQDMDSRPLNMVEEEDTNKVATSSHLHSLDMEGMVEVPLHRGMVVQAPGDHLGVTARPHLQESRKTCGTCFRQ